MIPRRVTRRLATDGGAGRLVYRFLIPLSFSKRWIACVCGAGANVTNESQYSLVQVGSGLDLFWERLFGLFLEIYVILDLAALISTLARAIYGT
jgi:hypothetical protein